MIFEEEHKMEHETEGKGRLDVNGVGRDLMGVDVGAIDIGSLQQGMDLVSSARHWSPSKDRFFASSSALNLTSISSKPRLPQDPHPPSTILS